MAMTKKLGTSLQTGVDASGISGIHEQSGGRNAGGETKIYNDKDGNPILDYIPAKRNGDGVVGFYDRVRGTFIVPTGNTAATPGTVTEESYTPVNAIGTAFQADSIPGLMVVVR